MKRFAPVILFTMGCASVPADPPADYFPLAVGKEWTYAASGGGDTPWDDTVMRVTSRTDAGFVIECSGRFPWGERFMLASGTEGVRLIVDEGRSLGLLRYPLRRGAIWNEEHGPNPDYRTRWKYEDRERVTVPAGTFDCVRIVVEGIWDPGDLGWQPAIYFWFAPDVGLVRSGEGGGVGHGNPLYELKSYR